MRMADDREVLKEIWEGKIPVSLTLSLDEVFTVDNPEPLYLLVPRLSYFPLVCDKAARYFAKYTNPEAEVKEIWLEEEGQPLKWHYPIGVLFDLSGGAETRLPWKLIVHFQNFPEGEILHCQSKEAVESYFISMIKEADNLKHRGQVISSMQKRDHKQLWLGLQNDKFEQFWAVNRKLMEHTEELFRHIPFKIYIGDKPVLQKLFKPVSEDGKLHTLQDMLDEFLPGVISNSSSQSQETRVLIQGIEAPMDTSVQWLSEHFSHPDNFLHICILVNR